MRLMSMVVLILWSSMTKFILEVIGVTNSSYVSWNERGRCAQSQNEAYALFKPQAL